MKKNLMKLLIIVLMVFMISPSPAQTFRVNGGLNLTKMVFKDYLGKFYANSNFYPGFHIGATTEISINEILSIETGLLLSTKGLTLSDSIGRKLTASPFYLDIPLNIKNSYSVGRVKIYGTLGTYLGIGVAGKLKWELATETTTQNIRWGSKSDDDFNSVDFGFTAGAGVEINALQFGLTYQIGLFNIQPYVPSNINLKNRNLAISIGYKIGGK